MKKSVTKRFKFTKTGKMIRRPMGVNHFKTRNSNKVNRGKRNTRTLDYPKKSILNY